jgi:hypothetical protein
MAPRFLTSKQWARSQKKSVSQRIAEKKRAKKPKLKRGKRLPE